MNQIKIFNHQLDHYFTLKINNDLSCEGYYNGVHLHGSVILQNLDSIFILWKHVKNTSIKEYIMPKGEDYYIQNEKSILPLEWNPENYKKLNPDLLDMDDSELLDHYLTHGIKEKRLFIPPHQLPEDFDPKGYKILNPDLCNFSDQQLKRHYIVDGIREKRSYKLIIDKDANPSFSPIFINHDCSLTGAPIFLYDYVTYLKNNNIIKNPIIVESYPNNNFSQYDVCKLYHHNDSETLLSIIKNTNPVFIYSNSLNLYYYNINKFKDYWYKTYFHFHETLSNTNQNVIDQIKNQKIFVVADRIKKEFEDAGCTNISVFPPFIPQEKIFNIANLSQRTKTVLKQDKIFIGMSGSISDRKNFQLFYNLAKACKNYEFVWIGGEDWRSTFFRLYNHEPESLPNFKHILYTKNPYLYFCNLDYFFLTSKNDPCPIVVLENLLLNKRVITLKNNIYYQHNNKILKHNLIEIEETEENKIIDKFKNLTLEKYKQDTIGEKYIEKYFSKPAIINTSKNITNYLIFSIYQSNKYNKTETDYFVNLINNFNINNNCSYKVFININIDNGYEENISSKKHKFFLQTYNKAFENIINLEHLNLSPNIGYDINGLLKCINIIYQKYTIDKKHSKLAYLHNKSNLPWREELNKIFYLKQEEIEKHDTIVCDKFFIECRKDDLNREIMKNDKVFKTIANKNFRFIAGTIFITKLAFLEQLYLNNKYFISKLTNMNTINDFWISAMKNDKIFNRYYKHHLNDAYSTPMDMESKEIVTQKLAYNFINLYTNFGKKGIPDLHFEHCLERYIGYLISEKKRVKML